MDERATKDVAGLWQANRNWLLGRARKLAGSAAEDLVQEVFMLVITLSPTPESLCRAWLHGVLVNVYRSQLQQTNVLPGIAPCPAAALGHGWRDLSVSAASYGTEANRSLGHSLRAGLHWGHRFKAFGSRGRALQGKPWRSVFQITAPRKADEGPPCTLAVHATTLHR